MEQAFLCLSAFSGKENPSNLKKKFKHTDKHGLEILYVFLPYNDPVSI